MHKVRTLVAIGGIAAAVVAATSPALADPPAGVTPRHVDIVGVGADVTQYVVDQLAQHYRKQHPSATRKWYSWDAVGSSTITEKAGCAPRTRPNGSGTGIAELLANARPANDSQDYCVDYARSSSGRDANSAPSTVLFIPFAIDAVSWSADLFSGTSNAPKSLTTSQLGAIFSCDASLLGGGQSGPVTWNEVGGKGSDPVIPVVPVSSSGTRKFFLQEIGVTTLGTCVQGQDNSVEQSEGTNPIFKNPSTSADIVFPYSVADYLAQSQNGHGTGDQGSLVLRSVNGIRPTVTNSSTGKKTINTGFPYLREIYNVVRNSALHPNRAQVVPKYLRPIFGNGSASTGWICTNATSKADIKSYGFLLTNDCATIE